MSVRIVQPVALHDAVDAARSADLALLALGRPACPACELLEVTLGVIAEARPGLTVVSASMEGPDDWARRETLLWPMGIRVSPASMPVLALLRDGAVAATRQGGGPAVVIDEWLTEHLGPPARPIDDVTPVEHDALQTIAGLRARHLSARAARTGVDSSG